MKGSVFPELVHGRLDGFEQGAWILEPGSVFRGGARCNLGERVLTVPHGDDPVSRVVRAHELAHIRVSPFLREHTPPDADVTDRALECAEEFRINLILARLGFDVALLCDGSERPGGQRLAQAGAWGEIVCFLLAVLGTGAESEFLRGVRSVQPTWVAGLRSLKKKVNAMVGDLDTRTLGDTTLDDEGRPVGYTNVTVPIARLISRSGAAAAPEGPDELRVFRRSLELDSRRAPSGVFAPVLFDESMPYVVRAPSPGHRRARPSTSGSVMRFPSRLLTDPLQRAFARKSAGAGGVIVIDQSGSMDVTVEELENLLSSAPDALIVGYSHRPGDAGVTPNAWILAKSGRVALQARSGNIGNGVDGPVLQWALRQPRHGGPVIWVTDGQVTDSHDHPCHTLSLECAVLVQRHRIRMVRNLSEVAEALRGRKVAKGVFGRVGRELAAIQSFVPDTG
ncbi:MAG TPA: hypothetical protein VIJ86_03545 [Acidimicrobiales bacterium]